MARITESQLRSIIKQELRGLLEGIFDDNNDDKFGLGTFLGDYGCDELPRLMQRVQEGEKFAEVENYSTEEIINGIKQRMNSPMCKGQQQEEGVTFTVKQHAKSHYGVGIVETVGTYNSFEEAVEVAKQGNRYIVSSEGKQFFPKYHF